MIIDMLEQYVGELPQYVSNNQYNAEMIQYVIACCILLCGVLLCISVIKSILRALFVR